MRLSDYQRSSWHNKAESRIFGKALAVRGLAAQEKIDAREFVRANMADDPDRDDVVAAVTKAGVSGTEYGSSSGTPALSSIAQGAFDATIPGQTPGKRQLPFTYQVANGSILATGASWRKDGRGIRVAQVSFAGVGLRRRSVGGIAVVTREFAELAIRDGTYAETLSSLMRDAIRRAVDASFCGSGAGVSEQEPAGIAHAAQSVSSTGTTVSAIATDVRGMVNTMTAGGVPFRSAAFVLSAEAYSYLAMLKVLDPAGTLAGRPVVTDAPSGTFLLVAADFLNYAVSDDVAIVTSTQGTLEMDDSPSGNTVTPAAATNRLVSLFQEDAIGLRAVLNVDWSVSGPVDSNGAHYAVVALTGSSYA
jgi:hypothetical protein